MKIIQILVAAYGVHIRVKPEKGTEFIFCEREALPFCKAVHHFRGFARRFDIEGHGALHAVEIIVQTALSRHEQRRGNAR